MTQLQPSSHFTPLKDPNVPPYKDPNRTWFMSTLTGCPPVHGFPEHFVFPSRHAHDKILCIDTHNKPYALGASENIFPSGGIVVRGLSLIADSYYDYENPPHALNAVSPFLRMVERVAPGK